MKDFFKLILFIAVIVLACKVYYENRNVRTNVNSAASATRDGVKTILKKGSDAL